VNAMVGFILATVKVNDEVATIRRLADRRLT
jgi:hypothetical protein